MKSIPGSRYCWKKVCWREGLWEGYDISCLWKVQTIANLQNVGLQSFLTTRRMFRVLCGTSPVRGLPRVDMRKGEQGKSPTYSTPAFMSGWNQGNYIYIRILQSPISDITSFRKAAWSSPARDPHILPRIISFLTQMAKSHLTGVTWMEATDSPKSQIKHCRWCSITCYQMTVDTGTVNLEVLTS